LGFSFLRRNGEIRRSGRGGFRVGAATNTNTNNGKRCRRKSDGEKTSAKHRGKTHFLEPERVLR